MIEIKKGKEPKGLKKLRQKAIEEGCSPEDSYKKLQGRLKRQVRDSLVKEQGALCAYCMCHIPRLDVDPNVPPITIEHFIARNSIDGRDEGQGLDYNNLFAVCNGNKGEKGKRKFVDFTCDAHRGCFLQP